MVSFAIDETSEIGDDIKDICNWDDCCVVIVIPSNFKTRSVKQNNYIAHKSEHLLTSTGNI